MRNNCLRLNYFDITVGITVDLTAKEQLFRFTELEVYY